MRSLVKTLQSFPPTDIFSLNRLSTERRAPIIRNHIVDCPMGGEPQWEAHPPSLALGPAPVEPTNSPPGREGKAGDAAHTPAEPDTGSTKQPGMLTHAFM